MNRIYLLWQVARHEGNYLVGLFDNEEACEKTMNFLEGLNNDSTIRYVSTNYAPLSEAQTGPHDYLF